MGSRSVSLGSSRRLGVLLLALVALPAVALAWLGLRLLDQDRVLVAQRALERREVALQAAARDISQSLADAERASAGGAVPPGAVRFTVSPTGITAEPPGAVLWQPVPSTYPEAASQPFLEAERSEFLGALDRARAAYRALADSPDAAVRAGAHLREARVLRKQQRWDEALAAYRALASIHDIAIEGLAADLVARRASLDVLAEASRQTERASPAAALEDDLLAGRWVLDRASWNITVSDIERARERALTIPRDRRALSLVAERLWSGRGQRVTGTQRSFSLIDVDSEWVTLVEQNERSPEVIMAVPDAVVSQWVARADHKIPASLGGVSLLTDTGVAFVGPAATGHMVRLSSVDAGLPWSVALSMGDSAADDETIAGRGRLLGAGLAAILLLFGGGSYFLWRVVQRELAVARLHTDFVAAVSHEFRTPLTSLRHVTELLAESDDLPRERRHAFYDALGRNTERLQRLVESLLDFARMESGRKPHQRRPLDLGTFLARIVSEFSAEVAPRGFEVQLHIDAGGAVSVLADASSLTSAMWNLLDNAAKYSGDERTIDVKIAPRGDQVAIAVRDRGIGIPLCEQRQVFERFVRGSQASQLSLKGTGLGLAIVSHVVRAHGGVIELESREGAGSTFTIVLPQQTPGAELADPVVAEPRSVAGRLE